MLCKWQRQSNNHWTCWGGGWSAKLDRSDWCTGRGRRTCIRASFVTPVSFPMDQDDQEIERWRHCKKYTPEPTSSKRYKDQRVTNGPCSKHQIWILGPYGQQQVPWTSRRQVVDAEVVTRCGKVGATKSQVDTSLSLHDHHHICDSTTNMSHPWWISLFGRTDPNYSIPNPRITHLSLKGNNPADIVGTSSEGGLAKTVEVNYHLDKGKRGYIIASINNHAVQVTTQLLANKLMRKCHVDGVPAPVMALVGQCSEGVQFN